MRGREYIQMPLKLRGSRHTDLAAGGAETLPCLLRPNLNPEAISRFTQMLLAGNRGTCSHQVHRVNRFRIPWHFFATPPPLARATLKFQNLTETTPPVALTRALFVRTVRRHRR